MGVNEITNLITNVGFPIAVCLIAFWYINKQATLHKDETDKLTAALNNNTIVMQQLVDKLNKED